jgi:AcrR family transcriptional regulator
MSIDVFCQFVSKGIMKNALVDPKQQSILMSAWAAFAAYGFSKTSMDDIARGAGMSRPGLYLHYRNKEDIFRSLAQRYYDEAAANICDALARDEPVGACLRAALSVQGGAIMEAMLSSPHGIELLDTGSTNAADIIETGEARLTGIYADWLRDRAEQGQVTLSGSPDEVAATITAALKGIKHTARDFADYTGKVRQLGLLFGAGLAAGV